MRIGIDFDNTIICYDHVFGEVAKMWQLVAPDCLGTKQEIKNSVLALPNGEQEWQRLQGKVYGEFINQAMLFDGVKEFISTCNAFSGIEVFIVSHKTELGHFDEKRISLREAARGWLRAQGFFEPGLFYINEANVYFESTREEKIARIKALQCTYFVDDLPEVLNHPLFPAEVKSFLFQSNEETKINAPPTYPSWKAIQHAIFS